MINYPIMEYFKLGDFQALLADLRFWLGNMHEFAYGHVDQVKVNNTIQKLYIENRENIVK